jgi:hypothetical protein
MAVKTHCEVFWEQKHIEMIQGVSEEFAAWMLCETQTISSIWPLQLAVAHKGLYNKNYV